jgi:L-gulonate 3-dehydrogenase
MLFASAHYNVTIYDVSLEQVNTAHNKIKDELETMEKNGILRGSLNAKQQIDLIKGRRLFFTNFNYIMLL